MESYVSQVYGIRITTLQHATSCWCNHCGTNNTQLEHLLSTAVPCEQMLQPRGPTKWLHTVSDDVCVHDDSSTGLPNTHRTTQRPYRWCAPARQLMMLHFLHSSRATGGLLALTDVDLLLQNILMVCNSVRLICSTTMQHAGLHDMACIPQIQATLWQHHTIQGRDKHRAGNKHGLF
jgi:hypothetical protein